MINVLCAHARLFLYSQIHVHVYDLVEFDLVDVYDYYVTNWVNASTTIWTTGYTMRQKMWIICKVLCSVFNCLLWKSSTINAITAWRCWTWDYWHHSLFSLFPPWAHLSGRVWREKYALSRRLLLCLLSIPVIENEALKQNAIRSVSSNQTGPLTTQE